MSDEARPAAPAVDSLPLPAAEAPGTPSGPLPAASPSAAPVVTQPEVPTAANLTPAQRSRMTPVVDAVSRAAPAVVSVLTEQKPQVNAFGGFFGLQEDEESGKTSLGSGVIVDARGLIVTNEHVVAGASVERAVRVDGVCSEVAVTDRGTRDARVASRSIRTG